MKKSRFIWIGLIVCLFSCTREEESSEMLSAEADMEFTAIWAEQDDSRTLLQGDDGEIWWLPSEKINVFYGNAYSGQFTSTNSAPAAVTQFRGKLDYFSGDIETSSAPMSYWAVYPYDAANTCDGQSVTLRVPDVQTGVSESFADKFFPAVAQSGGVDLAFYNVCGGARFSLVTPGVEKVVFRSVDGSPMAGVVRIGFSDAHKPLIQEIIEPIDSIVVNAPGGGFVPGTHYFATMLPQTHVKGLDVQFYSYYKSASRVLDKSIIIRRSTFGLLDNLDEGLNYDPTPIDLGLSVRWASFNVGASAPEDYGAYFAWGETEPKADYSWSTYKWCNGDYNQLTKYCTRTDYGYNGSVDNKTVLDPEDDAAVVNWGGSWRMPTKAEQDELRNNCTRKWTTLNGVEGIKLTSKKEGYTDKWIFLPAAGCRKGESLDYSGSYGLYWSSSLYAGEPSYAYDASFRSSGVDNGYVYRCEGRSVRPVSGEFVHVTGVSVSPENATVDIGDAVWITATITPPNASEKGLIWSSSDESVATVSANGFVEAVGRGTAEIAVTTGEGGFRACCSISVIFEPMVDLGLSVKWASCNLGAHSPWAFGDYFAWGEVEPKEDYSWPRYKWCKGSGNSMTKYCDKSDYGYNGFVDNKTVLDPEDDAAVANLGGGWRMPTKAELGELMEECTWTWTTLVGVKGWKVTSNKSGYTDQWIFFPAAGIRNGSSLNGAGSDGLYWSPSLHSSYSDSIIPYMPPSLTSYPDRADTFYLFYFSSGVEGQGFSDISRCHGCPVRPVYDDFVYATGVSVSPGNVTVGIGESAQLTAIVSPSNATDQRVTWSSSDTSVATIDADGLVTGISVGTAVITATTVDGGFTAECAVTVVMHVSGVLVSPGNVTVGIGEPAQLTAIVSPPNATDQRVTWSSSDDSVAVVDAGGLVTGIAAGTAVITATTVDGGFTASCTVTVVVPEAVDLGLSVKWASFNVGAFAPEDYGEYFAWGEVEPKDDYFWSTYKWCMNGGANQLTKYCNNSSCGYNGFMDNRTVLDPEDDAAAVNWGGKWRTPTYDEFDELKTQCSWTWTTLNGVYGRKVTSNKEGYTNKWIFLPATGHRTDTSLYGAGSYAYYWSSSLNTGSPYDAYNVYFNSKGVSSRCDYRYGGLSVRPVQER